MVLARERGAVISPGRVMAHENNLVLCGGEPELLSPCAAADLPVREHKCASTARAGAAAEAFAE